MVVTGCSSLEVMVERSGCGRTCPDSFGGGFALVEHNRSIKDKCREFSTSFKGFLLNVLGAVMVEDGGFLLPFIGFSFNLALGEYEVRSSDVSLLDSSWSLRVLWESTVAFVVTFVALTLKNSS